MTRYLLDGGVLAALFDTEPPTGLIEWMARQDDETLFVSAETIGEFFLAIYTLPDSSLKAAILDWLRGEAHPAALFNRRILPFDEDAARCWAEVMATEMATGYAADERSVRLAAIALTQDCRLVSLDEGRFPAIADVVNPVAPPPAL